MKDHVSYSSIKIYEKCPRRFRKSREADGKTSSNEAQEAGKIAHAKMADCIKNQKPTGKAKTDAFIIRNLGLQAKAEVTFDLNVWGTKIIGSIDAVSISGNIATIVDWKNRKSSFVDVEQLKLYAFALPRLMNNTTIENFECFFFYLATETYDHFSFNKTDMDEYLGELVETLEKISADKDFEPVAGSHCSDCPWLSDCPIAKGYGITPLNGGSIELVRKELEKVFMINALVSDAKVRIKEWMIENGVDEIEINDKDCYYLYNMPTQLKEGKIAKKKTEVAHHAV